MTIASSLIFLAAFALVIGAGVVATSSGAAVKRASAAVLAMGGATLALAAAGAPEGLVIAGAVLAFAYLVAGVALSVALQERYGGAEIAGIDAADAASELPRNEQGSTDAGAPT